MRSHDIGLVFITFCGLALLGSFAKAQEMEVEVTPHERVRVLVSTGGLNMEITLIDGQPADCRFEGKSMTMSTDPRGTVRFIGPEGQETVRILRDTVLPTEVSLKKSVRLGIKVTPPSELICSQLGLSRGSTLAVTDVEPGLAAERAGLRLHDIILAVGDSLGANETKLAREVSNLKPGQVLYLAVRRGSGHPLNIKVKAEESDWQIERRQVPIRSSLPILGYLSESKSDGEEAPEVEVQAEEAAPQLEDVTPSIDPDALKMKVDRLRYQELMMLQGPLGTERVLAETSKVEERLKSLQSTLEGIKQRINKEGVKDISVKDEHGNVVMEVSTLASEQAIQIKLDKLDERLARLESMIEKLAAELDE